MLNPNLKYLPIKGPDGKKIDYEKCIFLKNFITKKDIIDVGDYTYYDVSGGGDEDARNFENANVLYAFPGARLEIGRFCQIAQQAKFMLEFANHPINSFSTYPLFWNFLDDYDSYFETVPKHDNPKGKTVIENDVWIGYDALIMPGVKISSGSIIGARSIVTKDVPPYTIVAGSPARIIRQRFESEIIAKLLEVAWWDWPIEKIVAKFKAIDECDIYALME